MITKAGNELADQILGKAKMFGEYAKNHAVSYAQSNKPEDRALFNAASERAELCHDMHRMVCKGLHAVEAEMISRSGVA